MHAMHEMQQTQRHEAPNAVSMPALLLWLYSRKTKQNMAITVSISLIAVKACNMLQVASITAQSYGDVTLLANAATAVALTAAVQPACATASTVPGSTSVFANLNAAELDVDAGEAFGLQVQSQAGKTAAPASLQVGNNFTMDIRANSTSSPLVAFEVQS